MSAHTSGCGGARVAAYTVYNLGLCIPIGMARTALAVFYLIKHAIIECTEDLPRGNSSERGKEKEKVEQNRKKAIAGGKKAKGLRGKAKAAAQVGEAFVIEGYKKGKHLIEEEAEGERIGDEQDELVSKWSDQLLRGVTEIFWFGAPIYTVRDHWDKDTKVSSLGVDELQNLWDQESAFDKRFEAS